MFLQAVPIFFISLILLFLDSGQLNLDQYFEISIDDPYQQQSVELTLLVPTGKSIYLDESLKYFIYDIKNVTNTHDYKMVQRKMF